MFGSSMECLSLQKNIKYWAKQFRDSNPQRGFCSWWDASTWADQSGKRTERFISTEEQKIFEAAFDWKEPFMIFVCRPKRRTLLCTLTLRGPSSGKHTSVLFPITGSSLPLALHAWLPTACTFYNHSLQPAQSFSLRTYRKRAEFAETPRIREKEREWTFLGVMTYSVRSAMRRPRLKNK